MLSVQIHSLMVVLGSLWFGFLVYKKGQEFHWMENTLFDLSIVIGACAFLFARIGFILLNWSSFSSNLLRAVLLVDYPGYSFVGLLVGILLGVWIFANKGELRLYEGLDVVALAFMGAIPFERLGRVIEGKDLLTFLGVPVELWQTLICLVFFVFLWHLEYEYRTFEWYRNKKTQAKSGFIVGSFLLGLPIWWVFGLIGRGLELRSVLGLLACMLAGSLVIWIRSGRSVVNPIKLLIKRRMV